MNWWWIIALVSGAVIIAGLSFYAGRLLWLVRAQDQAIAASKAKKNQYLIDSIVGICKAMQAEQCELSEGALRVWVLLDHLEQSDKPDPVEAYPGIYRMYDVVKDMPTHSARKRQDKAHIKQLDSIREQAEVDLKDFILADVDKLLQRYRELAKA
ncbi:MAG: DUF2489 domain-containing protein [Alkalimonas sp.]|nr:DUF2489 domain-containing protein [Alkalimonas sp.]